jgi:hypothetical protein
MKRQNISTLLVILGTSFIVQPVMAQRPPILVPPPPPEEAPRPPARFDRSDRYDRYDRRRVSPRFRFSDDIEDRLDDVLTSNQLDDLREAVGDGEDPLEALADLDLSDDQRDEIRDIFRDEYRYRNRRRVGFYRDGDFPPRPYGGKLVQRDRGSGRLSEPLRQS